VPIPVPVTIHADFVDRLATALRTLL